MMVWVGGIGDPSSSRRKAKLRYRVLVFIFAVLLGFLWVKIAGVRVFVLDSAYCVDGVILSVSQTTVEAVGEDVVMNLGGVQVVEGEFAGRIISNDLRTGFGQQAVLRVGESFEHLGVGKYTLMSVERRRNWFGENGGGSVATVCFEPAPGFTPKDRG